MAGWVVGLHFAWVGRQLELGLVALAFFVDPPLLDVLFQS